MRVPSAEEVALLEMAADAWSPGILAALEEDHDSVILLHGDDPVRIFLVSQRLASECTKTPWPTDHAGLPLGTLEEGQWRLSLEAAGLVAAAAPGRVARLTSEGAARFLYGRSVPNRQVQKPARDGDDGRTVIVAAPDATPLGLGRMAAPRPGAKADLHNIVDLGWYLREGG